MRNLKFKFADKATLVDEKSIKIDALVSQCGNMMIFLFNLHKVLK